MTPQSSMSPTNTKLNRTAFLNCLISERNLVVYGAGSRVPADPEDRQEHI